MSTSPITIVPERHVEHPTVLDWLTRPDPTKWVNNIARADNLGAINAWLDANDLGPPLRKLGNWTEGEDEYVTILNAVDFGWVTVVTFATIRGDGTRGTQLGFYNVNSKNDNGAVLIPAINIYHRHALWATKYLLKREWRPVLGKHLVGCLRGFAQATDDTALSDNIANADLAALPLGGDEQRVCQVILSLAKRVGQPVSIGPFYENSGLYAGSINAYVFAAKIVNDPEWGCSLDAEAELMKRLRAIEKPGERYLLWTQDQILNELLGSQGQSKQCDGATAAALFLADHFHHSSGTPDLPILR